MTKRGQGSSCDWDITTRVIHSATGSGASAGPDGGTAVASPIWQTSTFEFRQPEDVAEAATAVQPETFYTRYGNPNFTAVQDAVTALERGEAALVTGSGMGAIMLVFLGLLKSGDHMIAQNCHYVGTMKALESWLPRNGIEITLVDQTDVAAFEAAIQPNTRLIFVETPVNPTLSLTDLGEVASLARERGITTCMDNTFATPINQRPLEHGIDLVIHSATKYLGGHSDVTAGVVVGGREHIDALWYALIIYGMISHPFEAWLLARGIQTLPFRVARQNSSALAAAGFLETHPNVERVYYPGLPSHPQHELAKRQMDGYGGMVVFELAGGFETARDFTARLKLARRAVSLGGTETLAVHAASMIHARLTPEQRAEAGISENLIRVSIGLEDPGDIIADFDQALRG
jgi:cystathionine beta-lyase/cystathionine gamma-synthase